ncbi:MAG: family 43 glycosylhydrolase [Flavobacteriales bacterium]
MPTEIKITNPIIDGYFADPSMVKHEGNYYMYTTIDPWGGDELAVFESSDFINWEQKHINWPTKEACTSSTSNGSMVWAPSVIQAKNGKFYMYVSVGSEIWAGVSEKPLGPWKNVKEDDSPFIKGDMFPEYHMIDAEAFIDDDGQAYLYWGSGLNWENGHCFIVPLNDDMVTFNKDEIKDITPPHYFEAPFMLKKNGTYYLMYSEGKCTDATYMVRYSTSNTPYGPWKEGANSPILSTSKDSTTLGPGHHTVFKENNQDYILYHRIKDNNETLLRELAIDSLKFDSNGAILKVVPQGGVSEFAQK